MNNIRRVISFALILLLIASGASAQILEPYLIEFGCRADEFEEQMSMVWGVSFTSHNYGGWMRSTSDTTVEVAGYPVSVIGNFSADNELEEFVLSFPDCSGKPDDEELLLYDMLRQFQDLWDFYGDSYDETAAYIVTNMDFDSDGNDIYYRFPMKDGRMDLERLVEFVLTRQDKVVEYNVFWDNINLHGESYIFGTKDRPRQKFISGSSVKIANEKSIPASQLTLVDIE